MERENHRAELALAEKAGSATSGQQRKLQLRVDELETSNKRLEATCMELRMQHAEVTEERRHAVEEVKTIREALSRVSVERDVLKKRIDSQDEARQVCNSHSTQIQTVFLHAFRKTTENGVTRGIMCVVIGYGIELKSEELSKLSWSAKTRSISSSSTPR